MIDRWEQLRLPVWNRQDEIFEDLTRMVAHGMTVDQVRGELGKKYDVLPHELDLLVEKIRLEQGLRTPMQSVDQEPHAAGISASGLSANDGPRKEDVDGTHALGGGQLSPVEHARLFLVPVWDVQEHGTYFTEHEVRMYKVMSKYPNLTTTGLYEKLQEEFPSGDKMTFGTTGIYLMRWRADMTVRSDLESAGWYVGAPIPGGQRKTYGEIIQEVVDGTRQGEKYPDHETLIKALRMLRLHQYLHRPSVVYNSLRSRMIGRSR